MKYQQPSFNSPANSKAYRDNWEKVFGAKKEKAPEENQEPVYNKGLICETCGKEPAEFYQRSETNKNIYLDLCAKCAGEEEK